MRVQDYLRLHIHLCLCFCVFVSHLCVFAYLLTDCLFASFCASVHDHFSSPTPIYIYMYIKNYLFAEWVPLSTEWNVKREVAAKWNSVINSYFIYFGNTYLSHSTTKWMKMKLYSFFAWPYLHYYETYAGSSEPEFWVLFIRWQCRASNQWAQTLGRLNKALWLVERSHMTLNIQSATLI